MTRLGLAFLLLALAWGLAGCATGPVGNEPNGKSPASQATVPPAATADKKTAYPITVKDATGHEVTFAKAPERIVSTSPAETEMLFALGLGSKIVAVSDFCNYPEEALRKPKIGGVKNPNTEAIIAASPDLVVGGISMAEKVAAKFRELRLTVYKVEPKQLEDVIRNTLLIGQITDTQEQAERLVAKMKADIGKVTEAVKTIPPEQKLKVYMEFAPGWTVGRGEFMNEMIELSGGVNIAADVQGWKEINAEKIIQDNPDVILYARGLIDMNTNTPLDELIRNRPGWSAIQAIRTNRLHGLDEDTVSRPGPRLTEALVNMAKAIYPDRVR